MATTKVTTAPAPVSSPEAEELMAAGAHPVDVDVNELYVQILKMQAQIDAMNAERGIPSDPVAAAIQNLLHHVKARQAANPGFDFAELLTQLEEMPDTPEAKDAELVRVIVDEHIERGGSQVEGLDYLRHLARDLHKVTLGKVE
jgi:hypothetical protein